MKIGILTLPLNINYGGILQAYALQTVLQRMGHEVMLIKSDRFPSDVPKRFSIRRRAIVYPKRFLCKHLLKKCDFVRLDYEIWKKYLFISRNIQPFIDKHFLYISESQIIEKDTVNVDAIVVGSDQVWRKGFTGSTIIDYFLNFLKTLRVKRIAYAASFGSDEWELTDEETSKCSDLAKKFKLITVREDCGVSFCQKYLQVNATHVLDPTMLLEKNDYIRLIKQDAVQKTDGNLFYYILDETLEKKEFVDKVALVFNLIPFTRMPKLKTSFKSYFPFDYDERYCFPSVASWLSGFVDADVIVTDSFHGCVFSIIFNKPFYVFTNKERGLARFTSLLRLFDLESRMIDTTDIPSISEKPIDWDKVNEILEAKGKMSISLLMNSLC